MRPGTRVPPLQQQAFRVTEHLVVKQEDGCWVSTRTPSLMRPYMEIPGGRRVIATRVVAAYFCDRWIEADEDVHHICETPRCVNPAHLKVERHVDHLAHHAEETRQTHCSVHGTPYDRFRVDNGWGVCKACGRAGTAAYRARKKALTL